MGRPLPKALGRERSSQLVTIHSHEAVAPRRTESVRGHHVSMDAPLVEGEDSNLYDVLRSGESPNPDRSLLHESLRTEIERALETLTPREADVIRLYFGLGNQHPMTLEEIGETFDLTRERVRQIKEKAIRRLKHTSRSKILKTYLG